MGDDRDLGPKCQDEPEGEGVGSGDERNGPKAEVRMFCSLI